MYDVVVAADDNVYDVVAADDNVYDVVAADDDNVYDVVAADDNVYDVVAADDNVYDVVAADDNDVVEDSEVVVDSANDHNVFTAYLRLLLPMLEIII